MIRFPDDWANRRTVLAHDWLTGMRGGERVLEWLCKGFPRAPILTLLYNREALSPAINEHPVHPSWMQHIPGIFRHYRLGLPLMPAAAASLRAPDADLLISLSHCVAKGIRPPPGAKHLCYCFTPMRYAWTFHEEYFGSNPLKRAALRPLLHRLQTWDRASAARVDSFVAISEHVRARIQRFYARDAAVVYPPADTDFFTPGPAPDAGTYDLVVSALVPYKRLDLAVQAYSELGWPLRVVGSGTEAARLQKLAGPTVRFVGRVDDATVRDLYRGCRWLLFPGEEDFGIVPVEAMACGRPVIAFARGGALESVREGVTGTFFRQQTVGDLIAALHRAADHPWDAAAIRAHAETFGVQRFLDGMAREIVACMESRPRERGDA